MSAIIWKKVKVGGVNSYEAQIPQLGGLVTITQSKDWTGRVIWDCAQVPSADAWYLALAKGIVEREAASRGVRP